ncbi:hypothetical protein [Pseudomonas lundensis]|uniref:hypothetical protein n=1 Tax=Pseudomonas lundensis TaxID=86185 RepID=UPI0006421DE3|nr:hypothetical protein [Pseudomonas lundensis]
MSDMVCRKSMMRCQTPGMCSPHGGCRDEVTTAKDRQISALIAENERLTNSLHEAREDRNKLGDRYDAVNAEVAGLRTGYEAYERVNAELKAEVEGLRKDSESYRLLSFCHGQGTLELVRSHHELCAEIRRLKILAGEPVPQTPEEFVGPSPEGPTARIRRKLAALGQGEQS